MTGTDRLEEKFDGLEEKLDDIDAKLDELSSESSGFDFVSEVHRLRAAILGHRKRAENLSSRRPSSRHDRAERIKDLQRKREQLLRILDERSEDPPDRPDKPEQ